MYLHPSKTKAKKEGEQREEKPSKLDPESRLKLLSREIRFLETTQVYGAALGGRRSRQSSRFFSIVLQKEGLLRLRGRW